MEYLVYYIKQRSMDPRKFIKSLVIILLSAVVMTACQKDEPVVVPTDSTPVQQLSQDDSSVEYNVDEVIIDAGDILSGNYGMKNLNLPCNSTLESVTVTNDTVNYHINYNGQNCAQTSHRTGSVIIRIKEDTQWTAPGAFLLVEFIDYNVTNILNGITMTINGTSSLENVSGGTIQQLGSGVSSVINKNVADVMVTFSDLSAREWHLTKMLVYTGAPGSLILAVNGFGNSHGYNSVLSWGKDREDKVFFSQVAQTVIFTEACSFAPRSGRLIYSIPVDNLTATVTYGYNSSNNPISGAECPTHYKLEWNQHGDSGTIYLPLTGNK